MATTLQSILDRAKQAASNKSLQAVQQVKNSNVLDAANLWAGKNPVPATNGAPPPQNSAQAATNGQQSGYVNSADVVQQVKEALMKRIAAGDNLQAPIQQSISNLSNPKVAVDNIMNLPIYKNAGVGVLGQALTGELGTQRNQTNNLLALQGVLSNRFDTAMGGYADSIESQNAQLRFEQEQAAQKIYQDQQMQLQQMQMQNQQTSQAAQEAYQNKQLEIQKAQLDIQREAQDWDKIQTVADSAYRESMYELQLKQLNNQMSQQEVEAEQAAIDREYEAVGNYVDFVGSMQTDEFGNISEESLAMANYLRNLTPLKEMNSVNYEVGAGGGVSRTAPKGVSRTAPTMNQDLYGKIKNASANATSSVKMLQPFFMQGMTDGQQILDAFAAQYPDADEYASVSNLLAQVFPQTPLVKPLTGDDKIRSQEANLKLEEAAKAKTYLKAKNDTVLATIDEALPTVNWETTGAAAMGGVWGLNQANVPGTPAYSLRTKLETIKANIAFEELSNIRKASTTGGGVGSVSDRDMNLLMSVQGSLDQGLQPEELKANLIRIKQVLGVFQTDLDMIDPSSASNSSALSDIEKYNQL